MKHISLCSCRLWLLICSIGAFQYSNLFLNTTQVSAAVHAVLTLCGSHLTASIAVFVGVKFEDSFLFDHHPGHPSVSHGQHHKQANYGACTKGEELNA